MAMTANSREQAVQLMDDAFNRQDIDALLALYEESAVVVTQPGETARGVLELRSFFESAMGSGGHANQLKTSVLEADGIALFLSRWTVDSGDNASATSRRTFVATTVFRKQADGAGKL
jgi:ketosteroid isomerase-like protein